MTRLALMISAFLLAGPALAVGSGEDTADLLALAQAALDADDFAGALALLAPIQAANPRDADALNLMGYASRRGGDLAGAATYYEAALAIEPDHLEALEYQGEMFVMMGDRAAAEANLARLVALCGTCEEQAELAAALAGS